MPHSTRSPSSESCTLEPIAICGMSCRLPGDVDSASSLWDMLVEKRSGQMDEVPKNRFNIDAHYHENLERPGSFNVRGGYFLNGQLEDFDPTAFNITPVEARWLDPQQRKMLEVSYECLESAGLTLDSVAGSNTAVFVGSFTSDYQQMSTKEPDFRHNYAATGVDPGIISNRIGNTFNLRGPSFTINTACSSSVYAIHFACHALRARDCDAAIVGGVNLILTVDQHMNTAKLGILSPTSTCHTFDAAADGYGRAEGAGALYLRRLSDAIRDGDPVRGVIRGTAVNTNGKVPGMGITHPSVEGQERVVRKAYEAAGLDPKNTTYAELHGTGTPVGDPIETQAIANALNGDRSKNEPLLVGAIKPNIGHSEAASGIFAVMKAALMTEAGVIPGVAHLKTLNPEIHEEDWNVKVNVDTAPWPLGLPAKRASVSSFGYGGTNGHVIVESVKALHPGYYHGAVKDEAEYDHTATRPFLLCFSAHDKDTLARNIQAISQVANKYFPADLAFTLNTRRTRYAQRAFAIIRQGQEAEALSETALRHGSTDKRSPGVGYLFTGQGAQWVGMGASAMLTFPSFRKTIRNLDIVLDRLETKPSFSLERVILGESHADQFNDAELAQPLCTAIQIAIVDLFNEWHIEPVVAIGHSSGEIGAAYAAGLISAPEAMLAAFYRGYAVKHHSSPGAMLAVGIGAEEVSHYLIHSSNDVVVACENSPNSVTLSGHVEAVHKVKKLLDSEGILAREVKTGKAYHSPQMEAVSLVYNELLSKATRHLSSYDLAWRRAPAPMISSVTGEEIISTHLDSPYWSENLRNRVRFNAAIATLGTVIGLNARICFIEIGPHSALAGPFKQICTANHFEQFSYVPSLLRDHDDTAQLLSAAGSLFLRDYPLDFEAINSIEGADGATSLLKRNTPSLLVDLPPYQWNYDKRYWAEPRPSIEQRSLKHARHDLLGSKISGLSNTVSVWRNVLRHQDVPWLRDHTLGNAAVFPAAGYMALAIEALRQNHEASGLPFDGVTLRDIHFKTALVIPETDEGIEIQSHLQKAVDITNKRSWHVFAIESLIDGRWTTHCDGTIGVKIDVTRTEQDYESPVRLSKLKHHVPGKRWYDAFSRVGFDYRGSFQQLHRIKSDRAFHEAAADVSIEDTSATMQGESRYIIHPATVDACLQLIIISIHAGLYKEMPWGVVPIKINEIDFWFPHDDLGAMGNAVAWTDKLEARHFNTHAKLLGKNGNLIMDVKSLRCVAYEAAVPPIAKSLRPRQPYMQSSWKPDISTLSPTQLAQHCDSAAINESVSKLVELLDHKYSLMQVTLLGRPSQIDLEILLRVLPATASITIGYARSEQMDFQESTDEADPRISTFLIPEETHGWTALSLITPDLIVVHEDMSQLGKHQDVFKILMEITSKRGWLVLPTTQVGCHELAIDVSSCGWSVSTLHLSSGYEILLCNATAYRNGSPDTFHNVVVLRTSGNAGLSDKLLEVLRASSVNVHVKLLQDFNASTDKYIILPDETHKILVDARDDSFGALKAVLSGPVSILWLIKGVKEGRSTVAGMVEGFLRVIRSEQAAARITLLDYDSEEHVGKVGEAILTVLSKSASKESGEDTEFWLHRGALHVDRITTNNSLNLQIFGPSATSKTKLLTANSPLVGSTQDGQVIFRPDASHDTTKLDDGQVMIQVQFSEPFRKAGAHVLVLGTILRTGSNVGSYFVGKEVVAYAAAFFSTIIRTSIWAPTPPNLKPGDVLASLVPMCPTVNASILTANVQSQEWLLLLPAPFEIMSAYIRLSQVLNCKLTVIANDDQEKQIYISKFSLSAENVFDAAHVKAIIELVQGPPSHSPCVVIAHEFSSLSKEVWRSIKPLGRFVLNETSIEEQLDILPFGRGASFFTARVSDLACQDVKAARELLKLTVSLLMGHHQQLLIDSTSHDVGTAQIVDTNHTHGSVVAYNYQKSFVQLEPHQGTHTFSADASYLLVGCLGGLGRSLTNWMVERGARHFAFISRSGADKSEAAEVIRAVEQAGASAQVLRADASNEAEIKDLVNALMGEWPIRGVVHAAMVLRDGLYGKMSAADFQAAIVPKLKGAQTLSKAFEGIDLDFFIMTSSISATLGNPGQCNYSAANSFLDSLAWQRNLRYQAGTSLILPMILDVGVVSENEGIEISLSRKGMYGIDEQEMLRGFETAMSQPAPRPNQPFPKMGDSQIILGLEPGELAKAIAASETVDAYWYNDARLRRIRAELERTAQTTGTTGHGGDFKKILKAALAKGLAAAVEAIAQHVMKRASSILMVPMENFEMEGTSIADHGLDSMIGAELRTWLYKEFGLDMPFQQLLSPSLNFKRLSVTLAEGMGTLALET